MGNVWHLEKIRVRLVTLVAVLVHGTIGNWLLHLVHGRLASWLHFGYVEFLKFGCGMIF